MENKPNSGNARIDRRYEIIIQEDKCISCGLCVEICPFNILTITNDGIKITNLENCNGCRLCENKCKFGLIMVRETDKISHSIKRPPPRPILLEVSQKRFPKLTFLNIHVTQACNLRCVHCFANADKAYKHEITSAEIIKIIDDAIELGLRSLTLTGGGEPLLRDNFCYEVVKFASDKGIHTRLCTNGTLLNRHRVMKLKKAGIDIVQVSLDSHEPRTHDDFRGVPGTFKKVISGIKLLHESGIKVMVRPTLHSKNYNKLPELLSLCQELGVSTFRIGLLRPFGRGKNAVKWYVNNEQIKEAIETLVNLREKLWGKIEIITDECYAHLLNPPPAVSPKAQLGCRAGVDKIVVTSNGSIIPCDTFNLVIGNIRRDSIKNVWENSPYLKDLRNIKSLKGKCKSCEYLWACGGGCRAVAYEIYKDIFAEDPLCWYQPSICKGD